jgi:hypothetical protein
LVETARAQNYCLPLGGGGRKNLDLALAKP